MNMRHNNMLVMDVFTDSSKMSIHGWSMKAMESIFLPILRPTSLQRPFLFLPLQVQGSTDYLITFSTHASSSLPRSLFTPEFLCIPLFLLDPAEVSHCDVHV